MKKRLLFGLLILALVNAEAARLRCGKNTAERFDRFLPRFQTERSFAVQRTAVPLEELIFTPGVDENGNDQATVRKNRYQREQIRDRELLGKYIRKNKMSVSVEKKAADSVEVVIFKDGTDWAETYRFRLRNGCWQLWQTEFWDY
jgi:hypothetical protein